MREAGLRDRRTRIARLSEALDRYADARGLFLRALRRGTSNRDPLAEFSEQLAETLFGGKLADNRVQKAYDLVDGENRRVQVKYLSNSGQRWVNEHVIRFDAGVDIYALLIFEDLRPIAMLTFERTRLAEIGTALQKKHAALDMTLQFTQRNFRTILAEAAKFRERGVRVLAAPGWEENR